MLAEGFYHAEALRWREGRIWFSDVFGDGVYSVSMDGDVRHELEVTDDRTESLGWLPNGDLLVVSMDKRRILRRSADGATTIHADLRHLAGGACNGMTIDAQGRAYVCNFGFDLEDQLIKRGRESVMADHPTANIIMVHPDGRAETVAEGLHVLGNAPVITPDGKTLIVSELYATDLTAFDVGADGRLSNRRVWATVAPRRADAMCLDAEGCVWFGTMYNNEFVRMAPGGEVLEVIPTDKSAWGCMLGGTDGRTLFLSTTVTVNPPDAVLARHSKIFVTQVEVPHAGRP